MAARKAKLIIQTESASLSILVIFREFENEIGDWLCACTSIKTLLTWPSYSYEIGSFEDLVSQTCKYGHVFVHLKGDDFKQKD